MNNNKSSVIKKKRKNKIIRCWKCHEPLGDIYTITNFMCPHCEAQYANKPINEAKLSILQEEFLKTRDNSVLNKMMIIMQDIIYNLICSKLRSSGKFLNEDDILDKVQWTLLKMTSYYRRESFKITTSFTEYLSQVILYPLYNYKQKDIDYNEISIFTPLGKDSNNNEKTILDKISEQPMLDGSAEVEQYLFNEIEKENTILQVKDFIHSMALIAYNKKGFSTSLKLLILYNHYLKKRSNRFFNTWWETEPNGLELRDQFEQSLEILKGVLYESAKTG